MVEDDSDSIQTPTRTHDSTQYLIWTCRSDTDACSICLKRYHRLRIILPLSVKQNSAQFHLMPAEHLILRRPSGFWPASLSAAWSTGQDPVHSWRDKQSLLRLSTSSTSQTNTDCVSERLREQEDVDDEGSSPRTSAQRRIRGIKGRLHVNPGVSTDGMDVFQIVCN